MLPLALETINVRTFPAVPLAERTCLPNIAAIYFVLNAQHEVQYIGRAKHLCFRWQAHHRFADFTRAQATWIACLLVTDPTLLPEIEKALIQYFAPPMNVELGRRKTDAKEIEALVVRIPKDILDTLREMAQENDRSLNAEIVQAIRQRVRDYVQSQQAAS